MSPSKVAKPCDLYIRVSDVRGRSGESFISPKDQEAKARALCALKGYKVGRVFTDLDRTGGKMERPAFDEAMRRALDGESGGIIVAKLDRFARNVRGLLEYVDKLESVGAVWACAEPTIDTGDPVFGRFLLTLFGAMAELELGRIKVQWDSSKRSAVERGIHVSRHVPPGYMRGDKGKLVPHPKHRHTIAEAYRLAAQGTAPARIAEYLTEQQLPSGDNPTPTWKSSRIKRLLGNRVYLGEARANGEVVNPNAHDPLTDPTTWLLAQRRAKGPAPQSKSEYLLSGLVRCAGCRGSMRVQKATRWAVATYRCTGATAAGKCPHPSTITAERLEEIVLDAFLGHIVVMKESKPKEHDDSAALATLEDARKALTELEGKKGELRPLAYAQALDAALGDVEAAEQEIASSQTFTDYDVARLVNTALPLLDRSKKLDSEGIKTVREALARDIQTVFVRPPAKRSKSLPISDRLHIVWTEDEEELELPTRGEAWTPRPYTWN